MTDNVRADQILNAAGLLHIRRGDEFFTEVKNGSTYMPKGDLLRIDGLAMAKSWTKPMFTGYEVKISRSDFLRDAKWHLYAEYCHRLVMVCPKGMIKATEVPDFAGLLWYNPDTKLLTTKKRPVTRDIEINKDMLYYILMSKLEPDRHPYFNSKIEHWQAWLDGKLGNRDLGYRVGAKLACVLTKSENELGRLRMDQDRAKVSSQKLDEVCAVMRDAGLLEYPWTKALEELRQRLSGGSGKLPYSVSARLRELLACAGRLAEAVKDVDNRTVERMG